MALPPGALYLAPRVPQLLAPPAAVYATSYVARTHFSVPTPTWVLAIAYVLCYPLALTAYIQWRDFKIARDAAAAGAVMPPVVEARWIGGLDLMRKAGSDFDQHILGTCKGRVCGTPDDTLRPGYRAAQLAEKYGYTFNFRALFRPRYSTSEPEYIKVSQRATVRSSFCCSDNCSEFLPQTFKATRKVCAISP